MPFQPVLYKIFCSTLPIALPMHTHQQLKTPKYKDNNIRPSVYPPLACNRGFTISELKNKHMVSPLPGNDLGPLELKTDLLTMLIKGRWLWPLGPFTWSAKDISSKFWYSCSKSKWHSEHGRTSKTLCENKVARSSQPTTWGYKKRLQLFVEKRQFFNQNSNE